MFVTPWPRCSPPWPLSIFKAEAAGPQPRPHLALLPLCTATSSPLPRPPSSVSPSHASSPSSPPCHRCEHLASWHELTSVTLWNVVMWLSMVVSMALWIISLVSCIVFVAAIKHTHTLVHRTHARRSRQGAHGAMQPLDDSFFQTRFCIESHGEQGKSTGQLIPTAVANVGGEDGLRDCAEVGHIP